MKRIVILGAGTGGVILANTLSRKLPDWDITIIDKAAEHIYQPGLLFIPFRLHGYETWDDIAQPIRTPIPDGVRFVVSEVKGIDYAANRVETTVGVIEYDWLIMAMGCHLAPEAVEGLPESMGKNAFTYYEPNGAFELQKALDGFKGGKVVLNIAEMPIKCPVAPIEFVFMADYYFHLKGIRDKVEIEFVTPLTGAFTKPMASEVLGRIAAEKNIKITPNFDISGVDHDGKVISSYSGGKVDYDLLVSIPPQGGARFLVNSKIAMDDTGYIHTDKFTMKALKHENMFVLGDVTNIPTSKAGSVAHFSGDVLMENFLSDINGEPLNAKFDGHSSCFIETGFGKGALIDFNYDFEPLPGKFPLPGIGPFTLLGESKANHWGKVMFKWAYWNKLITGEELPLASQMSLAGKDTD